MKSKLLSCIRLFATPWTVAFQVPLSLVFPRQEHWNRLPFLLFLKVSSHWVTFLAYKFPTDIIRSYSAYIKPSHNKSIILNVDTISAYFSLDQLNQSLLQINLSNTIQRRILRHTYVQPDTTRYPASSSRLSHESDITV